MRISELDYNFILAELSRVYSAWAIGQSLDFDNAYNCQCADEEKCFHNKAFLIPNHYAGDAGKHPESLTFPWQNYYKKLSPEEVSAGGWQPCDRVIHSGKPGHTGMFLRATDDGYVLLNQWGSDNEVVWREGQPQAQLDPDENYRIERDADGKPTKITRLAKVKQSQFDWPGRFKCVMRIDSTKVSKQMLVDAITRIDPGWQPPVVAPIAEPQNPQMFVNPEPEITRPLVQPVEPEPMVMPDVAEITAKAKKSGSKVGLIDTVFAGGGLGLYGLKDWFLNNVHGLDVHTITIAIVVLAVVYFWRKKTQQNYKINQAIDEAIAITPQLTSLLLPHKKRSMLTMRKPR